MATGGSGYARLITDQAAEAESLAKDVRARVDERWQLHHLLEQKNKQVHHERAATKRCAQHVAYAEEQERFYRTLTAFRGWATCAYQSSSRRSLSQIKAQLVEDTLREGCFRLSAALVQVVGRELGHASRAIWLSAAACTMDTRTCTDVIEDLPEDQVLCATPRSLPTCLPHKLPQALGWRGYGSKPEKRGALSISSEASTSAPASSSVSVTSSTRTLPGAAAATGAAGAILDVPPLPSASGGLFNQRVQRHLNGATCLVVALQATLLRRFFWAISRIRWKVDAHVDVAILPAGGHAGTRLCAAAAPAAGSPAASPACSVIHDHTLSNLACREAEAGELERRLGALQRHLHEKFSSYDAEREAQAARRKSLLLQATELARTEDALEASLHRRREQHAGQAAFEGMLAAPVANPSEAAASLLVQLQEAQRTCVRVTSEEAHAEQSLAAVEQRTGKLERSAHKLEARLAREAQWREQATEQIAQMVARGEELESERARLLARHAEAHQRNQLRGDESRELQRAFGRAGEANEELEARGRVAERDNLRLLGAIEDERSLRVQLGRRRDELAVQEREAGRWRAKCESAAKEASSLQRRVGAAQLAEEAEAAAAADIAHRVEVATCSRLAEEVAASRVQRFAMDHGVSASVAAPRVPPLQLASAQGSASPPIAATAMACNSVLATPRSRQSRCSSPRKSSISVLDELDAYAALVQRLRAELEREREEREASTRNLASLRASYTLLLQRGGASSLPAARA